MRNRDYKNLAEGEYYHIFNRGNGKQLVFIDEEDRLFFLKRMHEYLFPPPPAPPEGRPPGGADFIAESHTPYKRKMLPGNSYELICYVLMPNHFHFLIKQSTNLPISKLISKICTSYSMYFNKKYGKVGNLFQSKFKAVKIESDAQLMWVSAYIHNNPKTAGLVTDLENYPGSSYLEYMGFDGKNLCKKELILNMFGTVEVYKKFVSESSKLIKARKEMEHLLLD